MCNRFSSRPSRLILRQSRDIGLHPNAFPGGGAGFTTTVYVVNEEGILVGILTVTDVLEALLALCKEG